MITSKQLASYEKVRASLRKDPLGGITFNDAYNVATFGIDGATYAKIVKAMFQMYGFDPPQGKLNLSAINRQIGAMS